VTDTVVETSGTGASVTATEDAGGPDYVIQSGTAAAGYARLFSRRSLRYRPGQGSLFRFTSKFTQGVADSEQIAGPMTVGTAMCFGYSGTEFGLLHRTSGLADIHTLTLSAGASGNETGTVTIHGTAYPVAITSGTTAKNAYELVQQVYAGYTATQNDGTVTFVSDTAGEGSGALSYASDGTSAGTFGSTEYGAESVDTWIPQSEWNIDTLLGNRSRGEGFVFDPTKYNVFQISQQYLGAGALLFQVEDPNQGAFMDVHRIEYPNKNDTASLTTPIFKMGWVATNSGSTTNVTMRGASAAAHVEGPIVRFRGADGHGAALAGIGTNLTEVLSIRVRCDFNNKRNATEAIPIALSAAVDGTKPAIVALLLNTNLTSATNWSYHKQADSIIELNETGSAITTGGANEEEIGTFSLSKSGSIVDDLKKFEIRMAPGDVLTVAVQATSGTTDASVSLTWIED